MATGININGKITYIPKALSQTEVSQVESGILAEKSVLVVGDLDFLEKATPVTVIGVDELLGLSNSVTVKKIAHALFQGGNDPRITGGPSSVTLVSPTPTTRASISAVDEDAAAALGFAPYHWGPSGNKLRVAVSESDDAGYVDVAITEGDASETYERLGSGPVFSVEYDGAGQADTATIEVSNEEVVIRQTIEVATVVTLVVTSLAVWGTISSTPSGAAAGVQVASVRFVGLDINGDAADETLTFDVDDGTDTKTTTTEYSRLDAIITSFAGIGYAKTHLVECNAFKFNSNETAEEIVNRINDIGYGYTAVALSPEVSEITIEDLDEIDEVTIHGAAVELNADLWAQYNALQASGLAEVTKTGKRPMAVASYLAVGGTRTTPQTSDWTDAFAGTENIRVLHVGLLSTNTAVQSSLKTHLQKMAGVGGNPRLAIVGIAANSSKTAVLSAAKTINYYIGAVFQEVKVQTDFSGIGWWTPDYTALLVLGMHCGLPIAEPTTKKIPNILDYRQAASINIRTDAETLTKGGLMFFRKENGIIMNRSVTTYLQTQNKILCEYAAMESYYASVNDFQMYFDYLIGTRNMNSTAGVVKELFATRAEFQISENIIKDVNRDSIDVIDHADYLQPTAQIVPINSVNWIKFSFFVKSQV